MHSPCADCKTIQPEHKDVHVRFTEDTTVTVEVAGSIIHFTDCCLFCEYML